MLEYFLLGPENTRVLKEFLLDESLLIFVPILAFRDRPNGFCAYGLSELCDHPSTLISPKEA